MTQEHEMEQISIQDEIYPVREEYRQLFETDTPLTESAMEMPEVKDRCLSLGAQIKNYELYAESIKEVEKNLYKRRKRVENEIARLRNDVFYHMSCHEVDKASNVWLTLSIRKNLRPHITNEAELPADYIKVIEEKHIDNKKLLEDLKQGLYIPGAELQQTKSLTIS